MNTKFRLAVFLCLLIFVFAACMAFFASNRAYADDLQNPFIAGYERVTLTGGEKDYFLITINGLPVLAILHKAEFPNLELRAKEVRDYLQQGLNDLYRSASKEISSQFEGVKQIECQKWPCIQLGNAEIIRSTTGDAVEHSRLDRYKNSRKIDDKYLASYWKVLIHDVLLLLNGQEPLPLGSDYPEASFLIEIYNRIAIGLPPEGELSSESLIDIAKTQISNNDLEKLKQLVINIPKDFESPEKLPPIIIKVTPKPVKPTKSTESTKITQRKKIPEITFWDYFPLILVIVILGTLVYWLILLPIQVSLYAYRSIESQLYLPEKERPKHLLRVNGQKIKIRYSNKIQVPISILWKNILQKMENSESEIKIAEKLFETAKPSELSLDTSLKTDTSTSFEIPGIEKPFSIEYRIAIKTNWLLKHKYIDIIIIEDNWKQVKELKAKSSKPK